MEVVIPINLTYRVFFLYKLLKVGSLRKSAFLYKKNRMLDNEKGNGTDLLPLP